MEDHIEKLILILEPTRRIQKKKNLVRELDNRFYRKRLKVKSLMRLETVVAVEEEHRRRCVGVKGAERHGIGIWCFVSLVVTEKEKKSKNCKIRCMKIL